MARYPTYDEYKDKPEKGIKKCDELLKRQPKDISLLTTKLSLLSLLGDDSQQSKTKDVVNQLMACQTRNLDEVVLIEETDKSQTPNPVPRLRMPKKMHPLAKKTTQDVKKVEGLPSLASLQAP